MKDKIEVLKKLTKLSVMEVYNNTEKYINLRDITKKYLVKHNIDLTTLTLNERKELGYGTYSKDSGKYELIPLLLVELYPPNTKVYCPLREEINVKLLSKVDTDTRGGCIAYQLYREDKETKPITIHTKHTIDVYEIHIGEVDVDLKVGDTYAYVKDIKGTGMDCIITKISKTISIPYGNNGFDLKREAIKFTISYNKKYKDKLIKHISNDFSNAFIIISPTKKGDIIVDFSLDANIYFDMLEKLI